MALTKKLLGIDAGGTFTDFVLLDWSNDGSALRVHKVLSTPAAPEQAILQGIADLGLEDLVADGTLELIHGSTVATNALLENKGVRTVLITNTGFADVLTLGRQTRPALYQLEFAPRQPPVPPDLCLETGGRIGARREVLEPLSGEQLARLTEQVRILKPEAVAINLLFSFLDDGFEKEVEYALRSSFPQLFVCRSSRVLPEYREYERGMATWLNASLGPVVSGYLRRLEEQLGQCSLQIMQSSGETLSAAVAAERAVNLLLSGPAAGLTAISSLGHQLGEQRIISFDMGGTSTDVALLDGALRITNEGQVAGFPVAVPMVDMHTIGAGGGSIARLDAGGMLQVGPESAAADPGPACYGRGGKLATVTDANLLLGRLQADSEESGHLCLQRGQSENVISVLAAAMGMELMDAALGIIAIANEHMVNALRIISVQRGFDPADFLLASFGGAGGLHVCALAEAMGMRRAVVPVNPGVLSALGMLVAPKGRQFSRTVQVPLDAADDSQLERLQQELLSVAFSELSQEGLPESGLRAETSADLRYRGQSFCLNVPWQARSGLADEFERLHQERYGFRHSAPVELVNLRVRLSLPSAPFSWPECTLEESDTRFARLHGFPQPVPVFRRGALKQGTIIDGPAVITELTATTFVQTGWRARRDRVGNILLDRS